MTDFFANIVSGVIVGVIVYVISRHLDNKKKG